MLSNAFWIIIVVACGAGAGSGCHTLELTPHYTSKENCQKAASAMGSWNAPYVWCIPSDKAVEGNK